MILDTTYIINIALAGATGFGVCYFWRLGCRDIKQVQSFLNFLAVTEKELEKARKRIDMLDRHIMRYESMISKAASRQELWAAANEFETYAVEWVGLNEGDPKQKVFWDKREAAKTKLSDLISRTPYLLEALES